MQEDAAIEQLSAYLDGELTDTEAAELEQRLAHDGGLRAELESLRVAVDLMRTHGPVQAPPALYGDILRAVEDEPMPGGLWAWLQRPFGLPLPTLALAGVAVAVVGVTIGGAVVVSAPGTLRPAVADLDLSSSSMGDAAPDDTKKPASKEQVAKVDAPATERTPEPAPAGVDTRGGAGSESGDGAGEVGSQAAGPASDGAGTADASDPVEKVGKAAIESVDNAAYGSGTMYSGGPVVSVALNPSDLERVAALYQKFAGTRDARANKNAARIADLPDGTTSLTLDLPDDQARNAFEQELRRAFPGTFSSTPAKEDGFTLDHARMRLNITVASQVPGSSGGEVEQPPLQMLRKKASPTTYDETQAPAETTGSDE